MTAAAIRTVAGLDLGGTAIRVAIRGRGALLASRTIGTSSFDGLPPAGIVERLAGLIGGLLPGSAVLSAVGIGASGPVDRGRGMICNPFTLPRFSGFPLVDRLHERLGCRVVLDNDAMVAALAEQQLGAGQGAARMLMVTLGTGIGVALLIAGQPFRGLADAHPEGGHIAVLPAGAPCYCGAAGCWEPAASRTALQDQLRPLVAVHSDPDGLIAAAAAASSDPAILDAFHHYGRMVGRGLSVLHSLYMPDVTVVGGSAAAYLALFRQGLNEALARTPEFSAPVSVRAAALHEAGAIGAALMAENIHADTRRL